MDILMKKKDDLMKKLSKFHLLVSLWFFWSIPNAFASALS